MENGHKAQTDERDRRGEAGAGPHAAAPAHHAYGVNGIPLSDGPHAHGQDGEVGPGVGVEECEAAPAGTCT